MNVDNRDFLMDDVDLYREMIGDKIDEFISDISSCIMSLDVDNEDVKDGAIFCLTFFHLCDTSIDEKIISLLRISEDVRIVAGCIVYLSLRYIGTSNAHISFIIANIVADSSQVDDLRCIAYCALCRVVFGKKSRLPTILEIRNLEDIDFEVVKKFT